MSLQKLLDQTIEAARLEFTERGMPVPLRSPLFSRNPLRRAVVKRRLTIVIDILQDIETHSRALDFGPGFGVLLPCLSARFDSVEGVEIDPDQYTAAAAIVRRMNCKNLHLTLVTPDNELSHVQDGYFDCIVAADVLEHVSHAGTVLDELARVLSPKGTLIVSLPTESSIYRLFENERAGHTYHDTAGFRKLLSMIGDRFEIVSRFAVFGLFLILRCSTRSHLAAD